MKLFALIALLGSLAAAAPTIPEVQPRDVEPRDVNIANPAPPPVGPKSHKGPVHLDLKYRNGHTHIGTHGNIDRIRTLLRYRGLLHDDEEYWLQDQLAKRSGLFPQEMIKRSEVLAAERKAELKKRGFTEEVLNKRAGIPKNKRASGTNNNSGPPAGGSVGGGKKPNGQIPLTNYYDDQMYVAPIGFGTPPQYANLIVDTGSFVLWTTAADCNGTCGIPVYDPSKSSTYNNTGGTFDLQYAQGEATGNTATEMTTFGGIQVESEFGLIHHVADIAAMEGTSSGIIGMCLKSQFSKDTPVWIEQIRAGLWSDYRFGLYLRRDPNVTIGFDAPVTETAGGRLTINGVDDTLYTGDIHYTELNSLFFLDYFWQIPLDGMTLHNQTLDLHDKEWYLAHNNQTFNGWSAIIDSGTSLLYGMQHDIAEFYSHIPGSEAGTGDYLGLWSLPCDSDLSGVGFIFNGKQFTINPVDLTRRVDATSNRCWGTIGAIDSWATFDNWLFGDVFLKNVYSVFEYFPIKQVGFARISPDAERLTSGKGNNGKGNGKGNGGP